MIILVNRPSLIKVILIIIKVDVEEKRFIVDPLL